MSAESLCTRVMPEAETGWLPDLLYRDGRFESGIAFFADDSGKITRYSSQPADLANAQRLRNRAVLPGLVNAHSHAFQRVIRGRTEYRTRAAHDNFWTWREAMYHAASGLSPEDVFDVSRMAFLEMARSGITTVGEFHYLHHAPGGTRYDDPNELALQVIRAAREVGIRIALLRTAYVRAGWQKEAHPGQARFITSDIDVFMRDTEALAAVYPSDSVWVGVAPHSIRAVPLPFLLHTVRYARSRAMPVHMHVAEQPAEIEACLAEHGLRPIELLDKHGVLAPDFTAVHATHTTAEEIGFLARAESSICACPTTERNLGDGIAPADEWAETEINICLGSDSNVQIDLLEDARELEYHLRLKRLERVLLGARQLLDYATLGGAKSLAAVEAADFFTVHVNDLSIAGADPQSLLSNVVFAGQRGAIRDVYVAGKPILQDGRHKEQEQIIQSFTALQKRLWT